MENEHLRVVTETSDLLGTEKVEIFDENQWVPILKNLPNYNSLIFWSSRNKFSKKPYFERRKKKKIYYSVKDEDISLNLDYCLEEKNILHVRYKLFAERELRLSKLAVCYEILLGNNPDFVWVPHIRPNNNLVIGDHVFRSPVIIYKKSNLAFAFIPDLKTLEQNRPLPSILDFNLNPKDNDNPPFLAYGFGNYKPYKHVYFKHFPNREFIIKAGTDLTFRYYLILFRNKSNSEILQSVNNFFWQKYIRRFLYQNLEPQVLPYESNVKESFKAIFERHKYWGDLKINNVDCGGFWGPTWLGKEKLPLKFIKKEEVEEYLQTYSKRHRVAVIFNTAWFLNIRSAYGLRYFGELWEDQELINKSNKMLHLILELPRIRGVFPSLVLPTSENSNEYSTSKGVKAWWNIDYYNLVDTALAMYWTLKFSKDFDFKVNLVKKMGKELVELLAELQRDNGSIPVFVDFNPDKQSIIIDNLINSASSGAYLMLLIEYYNISKDNLIIPICRKICDFLEREIIPNNKWHDFEALYSCTYYSLVEYDDYTKSYIMNNLCIYWCAEGFLGLYRITQDKHYLDVGERIIATLSLFQQVWNMPYINYNTFGGFGCQNNDAELGDSRQALFVNTYMQYYLETGKEEYMERAIAALRASWALQLLSEYKFVSPGNLKGIDTIDTIDRGCISENYGHLGRDERIDNFILFDWGNGTASTASAIAQKFFGDIFIDFKEKLIWGINGVLMKEFTFYEDCLEIRCEIVAQKSKILIKCRDWPIKPVEIIINDSSLGIKGKTELSQGIEINI